MALSDELGKLADMHQRGTLSDEEFARAKARVLGQAGPDAPSPVIAGLNRLQRSRSDRWLGGVCGGLADLTVVAAWLWRLMFVLLMLCGGTGVVAYVLLWIFVPDGPAPLAGQRGEPA